MNTKRIWRLLYAVLSCLLFTSCEDVSKSPLSDPEKSKADPRLEGKWLAEEDPHAVPLPVVSVGGKLPDCIMECADPSIISGEVEKSTEEKDAQEKKRMLLFPSQIGERHFLNVFEVKEKDFHMLKEQGWKPDLTEGYYVYLYKIEKDRLTLLQIAEGVRRKAIESGKIKGVIDKHSATGGYLSDTTANISQFYGNLDDKQFENFMTWKKVK